MVTTLHLARASAVGSHPVEPVTIQIDGYVPQHKDDKWETLYREFYSREAKALVSQLVKTLPGGTLDAVLVELLDHKRSLFRVPHST